MVRALINQSQAGSLLWDHWEEEMPKNFEGVMHEFGKGKLHSGSKEGPEVKNPKQAVAIAFSEQRQMGKKVPEKPHFKGITHHGD